MHPQIIINADDFGYSEGVNEGIRKAYHEGILTSTTVLANGPTVINSLQNLHNNSSLPKPPIGIGVHLNLTFGKPLEPLVWNFSEFNRPYKEDPEKAWTGNAWKTYFSDFSEEQIEKEYEAQIEKMRKTFDNLDHLDSHHASASYPPVDKAYMTIAQKYHLAVRPLSPFSENSVYGGEFTVDSSSVQIFREKGVKTVDSANMSYWHNLPNPIAAFCHDLATVKPNEVREYMFHPATDTGQGDWRMKDLEILTSKEVIAFLKGSDIQLTTYDDASK